MLLVLENRNRAIKIITLKSKKDNYLSEEKKYIFYYSKNVSKEKFAKSRAKI
jgi:hypothetical protein